MDKKVVVAGVVGGLGGGVIGYLAGKYVERKEKSIDKGLATELLGIFGSIAGGIAVAASANWLITPSTTTTTTTSTTLPPVPVGPQLPAATSNPQSTAAA